MVEDLHSTEFARIKTSATPKSHKDMNRPRHPVRHCVRIAGMARLSAVILVLALVGCMAGHTGTTNVPSGWTVTIGESGGFTGGGGGYEIRADGRVRSWTRLTPHDDIETQRIGKASDQSIERLYAAMTSSELRDLQLSEAGNMTAFLNWTLGDETRHYFWPEGTQLPGPVARAQDAAMAAVEEALANP